MDRLPIPVFLGFPCGSAGKESTCNVGDLGLIPGLGRSLGEGKGYSLQYSGLENSMECIVHGFAESDTTKRISLSEIMWDITEDVNFISKDPEFWNASPKGTQWKGLESLSFTSESSDLVPGMFQTSSRLASGWTYTRNRCVLWQRTKKPNTVWLGAQPTHANTEWRRGVPSGASSHSSPLAQPATSHLQ